MPSLKFVLGMGCLGGVALIVWFIIMLKGNADSM